MPHIESYILVQPPSKLDFRFKRYQHVSAAQNKEIQRKLEVIIDCILKSILASSDSFAWSHHICFIIATARSGIFKLHILFYVNEQTWLSYKAELFWSKSKVVAKHNTIMEYLALCCHCKHFFTTTYIKRYN